jgi:hypothetical protein
MKYFFEKGLNGSGGHPIWIPIATYSRHHMENIGALIFEILTQRLCVHNASVPRLSNSRILPHLSCRRHNPLLFGNCFYDLQGNLSLLRQYCYISNFNDIETMLDRQSSCQGKRGYGKRIKN